MKKLCKDRIDHEIYKLKIKGLLEVVNILLVSPEFFYRLHFETDCVIWKQLGDIKRYINYKDFKIIAREEIRGDFIIPLINPDKLS